MITISRSLSDCTATLCEVKKGDEGMTVVPIASVDYLSTSLSRATAVKELKAKGYAVKKGAIIDVTENRKVTYACTLDAFLTVAEEITE